MNVPLIAINPIPGQEEENAEFLEEMGLAIWVKKGESLEDAIEKIIDKKRKQEIRENIERFAKPNSASEICRIIIEESHK